MAEVVLGDDLFRNYVQDDLHILIARHRSIVIKKLNIQSEETGTGGRDGAIQKALSSRQAGAVGFCVAGEFQLVAANGDTDTMIFGLVGPDAGNKSRVGDCASGRDCGSGHKKNHVRSLWH